MENRPKSPLMQEAIRFVKDILRRMENDECSDEQVGYVMGKMNAENAGYYKSDSFYNYDQAMRKLHIGNRVTLKQYLDLHRVKMRKVGNVKVGFLATEIDALAMEREKVRQGTKSLT